jgi:hypothetical protein
MTKADLTRFCDAAVNAMLLNEFLKQHKTVEELESDRHTTEEAN